MFSCFIQKKNLIFVPSKTIGEKCMKYLSKLSMLLLFVALAFCACDKNNGDDDGGGHSNPPQPSEYIYNFTGKVEFEVDAPQIKEKIEQALAENPPFEGAKKYQLVIRRVSSTLAPTYTLGVQRDNDETSLLSYRMESAGEVETKENYKLFSFESGIQGWNKCNIVPIDTEDGKPVATYDVFIKRNIPASVEGSTWYFCEDLTKKYRQMFPGEDIHAVVRRLVLSYVNGGGIVKD